MNVRRRHFYYIILIFLFVVFNLSFVIFASGCGDVATEITAIIVSPPLATVGVNQVQSFRVLGRTSAGYLVDLNSSVSWSATGNIGTISTTGILTAGTSYATGEIVATYSSISGKALVTITGNGSLTGIVSDQTSAKVNGIKVYLKEIPALSALTDAGGKYTISYVTPGTYEARIDATTYYQAISNEVTVGSGESVTWSPVLQLQPNVPTIPPTTIPVF